MRRSKRGLVKCLLIVMVVVIILHELVHWMKLSDVGESDKSRTKDAKSRDVGENDNSRTKDAISRDVGESDNSRTKDGKSRTFLVIGVPTVKRPKAASYLSQTLRELVEGLEEDEKSEVLIIVFVTDFHPSAFQSVHKDISESFAHEMNSGLLRVVTAPQSFYPSLDNLPKLWGDSTERIRWRSKQCLDYAFLFSYSKHLGDYYLQIEDDVSTTKGYLKAIKNFTRTNLFREWSVLEFGARGFIGMMYRTIDVGRLSMFIKSFYWVLPVDLLFRRFNDFHLYGNPDWAKYRPPLFRHVGTFSSLAGQVRRLEDVQTSHRIYKDSHNPPANVTTSIASYNYHTITAAYDTVHHGMFWGKDIKPGDYILLRFYSPARISKLIIESGGVLAAEDYFGGAKISYSDSDGKEDGCGPFSVWQEYKDTGQLKAQSKSLKGVLCQCLKIEITKLRKDNRGTTRWLAIREIAVWTKS